MVMRCVLALICGAVLLLSGTTTDAFERERAPAAKLPKKAQKPAKKDPDLCAGEKGEEKDGSGYVDIDVRDEYGKDIAGFIVMIDGLIVAKRKKAEAWPTPLPPGLPLRAGHHKIEVTHAVIGTGCMTVTVNLDDVAKVTFQFFRLREKVTEGRTKVLPREHHGALIVRGILSKWYEKEMIGGNEWRETEVVVTPTDEVREIGEFWLHWKKNLEDRYDPMLKKYIASRKEGILELKGQLVGEARQQKYDVSALGENGLKELKDIFDKRQELESKEMEIKSEIESARRLDVKLNEVFAGCFDVQIPAPKGEGPKVIDCGPFDARESRGNGTLKISDMAVGCYAVELRRKDGKHLKCGTERCRSRRLVKVEARTLVKQKQCAPSGCKVDEVPSGKVAIVTFETPDEPVVPTDECVSDPHVKAWLDGPLP